MKIVSYVLIGLLVILLAGAGYFYMAMYKPMTEDLAKLKAGQPEFDKARAELKKFRDREKKDAEQLAWLSPTADSLKKAFENEIAAGKAEVVVARDAIILNAAEDLLFTPHSKTFAKDSPRIRATIAQLLKGIKDKEIRVGNMTQPAPPAGKGRKKIPGMDARTLAALRSIELVKDLAKNEVPEDALIVESYPAKQPDRGFKLREKKTVIVIAAPARAEAAAPAAVPAAQAQPKPVPPAAAPTATAPQQGQQPKLYPISPAPPAGR